LSKQYITLGIGGNIGNTKRLFKKLLIHLRQNRRIKLIALSPILKNPPFGYLEQNDFLNAIIVLESKLNANDLFKLTSRLEWRFKRKRSFQDAPRTLDIDIIFFKNKKIRTQKLIIPHKEWQNRESVTIPLSYVLKSN
jgi:2-amino-4-hydroxy-6-hydroxymethyldihydropteridine diphosphokinase